jgi:hypothetical protein
MLLAELVISQCQFAQQVILNYVMIRSKYAEHLDLRFSGL